MTKDRSLLVEHDRAADRSAHRAADRLADIGGNLAGELVGDRARDLARDQLAGGETLAARTAGAEDRAEHTADVAEQPAAILRSGFPLRATRAGRRGGLVRALHQHLIGGLRVDRLVVLALQRALPDDCS